VKELEETAFMQDGELPPPTEHKRVAIHRDDVSDRLLVPFQGFAHLDALLADLIARQRFSFGSHSSKACSANDQEDDIDTPPDPDEPVAKHHKPDAKAQGASPVSRGAPSCPRGRLPCPRGAPLDSDYVAYMAKCFKEEWANPRSEKKEPRPLKRDQVLFVA